MTTPTTPTATPLSEELAAVRAEIVRTDGLSGTLTGVSGVLLALLAPHLTEHDAAVRGVFLISCGLLVAALFVLLLGVIRPRLGTTGFCMFAELGPDEIGQMFTDLPTAIVQRRQVSALHALSAIADRKYRLLWVAIRLICAAAAALVFLPLVVLLQQI